ncbi:hypothetical protein [Rhodovulum sp. YEN HP10]|uniref:hypothetical protein n=1 Tax=Rhodovulum sp. HP10 TaxID=3387397 RepID=UPI0039DF7185
MPDAQSDHIPADRIPVNGFRLLFQWPLTLSAPPGTRFSDDWIARRLAGTRRALDTAPLWTRLDDPLDLLPPADDFDGGAYAEFAYFHDFTQSFLYPPKGKTAPAYDLYQRTDVTGLVARIADRGSFEFAVRRHTLHLFRTGVAILSLELELQGPAMLADCQALIDHLRRTYVPFWEGGNDKPHKAKRVPERVSLIRGDGTGDEGMGSTPPGPEAARAFLDRRAGDRKSRDPDVLAHWRDLIAPLKLIGEGGPWRDPSDERMPVNSFISLTPPGLDQVKNEKEKARMCREALGQVSNGDWFRLWDAEEPGTNGYPYNPDFLEKYRADAFYDRFYPSAETGGSASRMVFGGMHFGCVGAGFFTDNIMVHHWRRHYAQMSLIARFEATMLLLVSSRISRAVGRYEDFRERRFQRMMGAGANEVFVKLFHDGDKRRSVVQFEEDILEIMDAFQRFVNRFHFTGVTSQTQGREMFELWQKSLGLRELFRDVKDEIESVAATVAARQQKREARSATKLQNVAFFGIAAGLVVGALGANLLIAPEGGQKLLTGLSEGEQTAAIAGLVVALFGAAWVFYIREK